MTEQANETLFNKNVEQVSETLFEQYKLYVETANQTSERRGQTNTFFISVHTAIIGLIFTVTELTQVSINSIWIFIVCIVGLFLAIVWHALLYSYRNLNSARYRVIIELEKSSLQISTSENGTLLSKNVLSVSSFA